MTDDASKDRDALKDRDGILPGNATPLERAIADTDGRLDDIDADLVRRVGGPDISAVPAPFLPARAFGRSVDVWDQAWPEDVQRAVIEAAPIVHRQKGSPFAVKAALAALRVDAEVVQWWQETPRGTPYTFRITAFARARLYDGPLLDARLIRVVHATVMRTKPLTRAFDLAVAAAMPSSLGLAPVALAVTSVRTAMRPASSEAFATGLGLAPVAVGRVRVNTLMIASP